MKITKAILQNDGTKILIEFSDKSVYCELAENLKKILEKEWSSDTNG